MLDAKNSVSAQLRKLAAEESGATAIEYGLIAAGIAVAIIAIVFTLGNDLAAFFTAIDTKLTSKTPT
ncbi:MAG: Flp family type IVb pilin [Alphaproteobacteria bacterium]|nr:Flp family type IVb pilin [Alphaproteobacteria bacterium]